MNVNRSRPFFGYHMPNFTFPGVPNEGLFGRVVELAQAAEAAGFELVTVMDHFNQTRALAPKTSRCSRRIRPWPGSLPARRRSAWARSSPA